MPTDSEDGQLDLLADRPLSKAEKKIKRVEDQRRSVLEGISSGELDTLERRVAHVLSTKPESRNSDITLQLEYWERFEAEIYAGGAIDPADLFKLTRLTSLARARARIQNTYRLFQASEKIKKRRGTLSEEERAKATDSAPPPPVVLVYADESGKTQDHLIVGSAWFTDPFDATRTALALKTYLKDRNYDGELHFKKLKDSTESLYRGFVEAALAEAPTISFKSVVVPRKGTGNVQDALAQLFYLLVARGIQHEHDTGRAPLPRGVALIKDAESEGPDRLLLAEIRERLETRSHSIHGGKLTVDGTEAMDSARSPLLQLADLFTSSISRRLNRAGPSTSAKDRFADWLLGRVQVSPEKSETSGDMAVVLSL